MKKINITYFTKFIFLYVSLLFAFSLNGQVFINEICSKNAQLFTDEDNDFEDWIELYNNDILPVNLLNWSISDDISNIDKWTFPEIFIPPKSYLTVFASGKNRKHVIDHWETVIYAEEIWKYRMPSSEPEDNWMNLNFNDSLWLEGIGGFGRGDGDDNTILPDTVATVYLRKKFTIIDTSKISVALLHVDYDDAFVAYLNGVEIARDNIGYPGKPPKFDDYAYDVHEAKMYKGLLPDEFKIDINLLKSILIEGENILAVQALNAWNNHGNFSIIPFLSFGINDNSFTYYVVPPWFMQTNSFLHTNFKLSGNGEEIIICDSDLNIIDHKEFPYLQANHSFGRYQDGASAWVIFKEPTSNLSNNSSVGFTAYAEKPEFSLISGFYSNQQQVSIINNLPNSVIRFSLDGSCPTDSSLLYEQPIDIDSTLVLKAGTFHNDYLPSDIETSTYFINDSSSLPVFSISIDPNDLWDWCAGIYVMGPNANPNFPHFGANFWQDWEKPAHIEYYDKEQHLGFKQNIGLKIHGHWSRAYPMKGLRILAKEQYGKSEIDYQLFPDKEIYSFQRFILRNSGQDYNITHFRDALMHKIVQNKTPVDIQDYQPAIVFINGKYWGVHNIREKIDRYYVNGNYNINIDSIDLLKNNYEIVEGNYYDYAKMIDYIKNTAIIDSIVYDSINAMLNIENYTDYFISEMFYVNPDWPNHNIKYWKSHNDTSRWKYMMTDLDPGLGLYYYPAKNELYRILHGNILWCDNHTILRRLIENIKYKHYFINRYADLLNTIFKPENIIFFTNRIRNAIMCEMQRHFNKWGGNMELWESNVQKILNFANERPGYVRTHIQDEFNLEKQVVISLEVDSTGTGSIKINTIIPDSLPWQGIYFSNVPVELMAIPDSGYLFSHWQSNLYLYNSDTLNKNFIINLDTNDVFKAFFILNTIIPDTSKIVFNEINYKSASNLDADDWVELYNYDTTNIDISDWIFKDGNDVHEFHIPSQTILDSGQYLVLCRNFIKFNSVYPDVENVIGDFDFGLSKEGETIRLYDNNELLVVTVTYSSESPWPDSVCGTGRTLELDDPYEDLNDGTNWFAGCIGGSPGQPYTECDTIGIAEYSNNENISVKIFPNPFSETAKILIISNNSTHVDFYVYNSYGLLKYQKPAITLCKGKNIISFKKENLTPGIYFYHFKGNNFIVS
ncbi:MAG: CotH kinase family protein, partial [Bacteroidales bacterium]|nr:CotH kinase family protein [Bacteroidales bacterium]